VSVEPLLTPELLARLDRLSIVARRRRRGTLQGERRSPRHGQSVEFADFRPYAYGDDVRQIDWNAYARLERFFLKLFVAEEDSTVHVLVDTSRSMGWGSPAKLDFARRVAAAIGYVALANLEWVNCSPVGTTVAAAPRLLRGRAAAPQLFAQLSALRADGGTDLMTAVRRYAAMARRPGPLVLLSDLYDPSWQAALGAALAARYDLTVLHVLSPEEMHPELEGDLRLVDDETGEVVEITAEADVVNQYMAALAQWQAEIAAWCRQRGVPYVPVVTDLPLDAFVVRVLRARGVVG
jgi:uncharacterized protein (DUF58 family)